MSSDEEEHSSSKSLRKQFKDDWEFYEYLLERKCETNKGLAKLLTVIDKFRYEFFDFNDQYQFLVKKSGGPEENSVHDLMKLFVRLKLSTPPASPKSFGVKSNNCSNYSTLRKKNTDDVDDEKLTDEGAATIEKNQQPPKDQNEINDSSTLKPNSNNINVQGKNNIIWVTADSITRQLLRSSTSSAARIKNYLNYSIKRKMSDDDEKIIDELAASIGNNQKQKDHPKNTKVNIKTYTGLTWTSPTGITRKILAVKPQPSNTTLHTSSNNTAECEINTNDQDNQQLNDDEDPSIKNDQHLKADDKKTPKTITLKPYTQTNNSMTWITSAVVTREFLDCDPQPSICSSAIFRKREISNDVTDYETDEKDLSIESNQTTSKITDNTIILQSNGISSSSKPQPSTSTDAISLKNEVSNDVLDNRKLTVEKDHAIKRNQQIKDDPDQIDNTDVNTQACNDNTLPKAFCAIRQRLSSEPKPSTSAAAKYNRRTKSMTSNEFLDGKDISIENKLQQEYPKKTDKTVILGPNGTEVTLQDYDAILWTTAAAATRQLLGFVFTDDILATHTLTGKPSPAFYGRERPEKMQLNPKKISDIIHCIRALKNCSEREVRGAITTKCSDTSKKFKRQSLKQSKPETSP